MRAPDAAGLLCALVLAPRTFARNRHFALFARPDARRARRRAAQIRSALRHLCGREGARGEVASVTQAAGGRTLLRYRIPRLDFARTLSLDDLEIALVRFALGRAGADAPGLEAREEDRARVLDAVAGLGRDVDLPGDEATG